MKRTLLPLTMLLALAWVGSVLTQPSPSAASRGNVASASGSGHHKSYSLSFGAADHGESNYTGQATFIYESTREKVTIDVECITTGKENHAVIGGMVTKSTHPDFPVMSSVSFDVIDNGEGAGEGADQFTLPRSGGCKAVTNKPIFMASDRGNIQVRFIAPDNDCTKCPVGTHCAGNGECVGGGSGGGNHCPSGFRDCCGVCVEEAQTECPACPAGK